MTLKMKFSMFLGGACLLGISILIISCNSKKNVVMGKGQNAADLEREKLIDASQAGAVPLFFDPNMPVIPTITPGDFSNDNECEFRGGLPNFFDKVQKHEPLLVGYIGGSITRGHNLYRTQSARFIQNNWPGSKMKFINAGISGTGTDLGACRIREQLLQYKPDLIFIEFAVNDAFPDGMEGMIRQIWKYDPSIDICLIYTLYNGQTKIYASGKVPVNILGLEKIAGHYQIPSVHMGLEASFLEKEGRLLWKAPAGTNTDQLIFSNDGTHPITAGGNLYAQSIARSLLSMKARAVAQKHTLPKPLIADNWEDAKLIAPLDIANFSKDWSVVDPQVYPDFKQFSGWFPYIMKAENAGASFSFKFRGTMVGFFDIGGPEAGQLVIEVDGKKTTIHKQNGTLLRKAEISVGSSDPINRFNFFCNNRYRGQAEFLGLPQGEHTVKFIISSDIPDKKPILGEKQLVDITSNPAKYNRAVIYIGKILIRGEMIK
jgi:hypothetical protein